MMRATTAVTVAGRAAVNVTDRVEEELSAPLWTGLILAVIKVCFAVGNVTSVVNIKKNGKKKETNGLDVFRLTKGEDTNATKPSFYERTEQQIGRQEHNVRSKMF
ncbi:hypothetical protein ATANTOWER_027830 [Ataeniobius toweri]|uniref:Uncharacterized protein n=1 Tax=Ataeniobius toweri TaxID=208326 RepID=A0ABU7BJB7_9TELE|nr:hypothetical protein [Ataeniobius toweri]